MIWILLCILGSVTNNNGCWIGFIGTSLQLQLIIKAHNQCLSKTRSILYWTTSVYSSTVMNEEPLSNEFC
jgi:hypothetical protein